MVDMPGYDRHLIVDIPSEVLREFICGICLEVFHNPTVTECCGQTYCYECINEWLSEQNTCPNDRKYLSADRLKPPSKMVTNLLNNMKIKCLFQDSGCPYVVKQSDLDNHVRNECQFNPHRKCQECGYARADHACTTQLVEGFNVLSIKMDSLRTAYEHLTQIQVADQIRTDAVIAQLFDKIERLKRRNKRSLNGSNINSSTQPNGWASNASTRPTPPPRAQILGIDFENLDNNFLLFLEEAGLTKEQLKQQTTRKTIAEVINTNGGMEAVLQLIKM